MFKLERTSGDLHECLVHLPLQTTLFAFQRPGGKPCPFPEELVKPVMKTPPRGSRLLAYRSERYSLRYGPCHNVRDESTDMHHADLKLSNIMLGVEDESVFVDYEQAENSSPSPSKHVSQDRRIYASRSFRSPHNHAYGPPILCDFGEARIGIDNAHVEIQPEIYKAPQVLMETGWTHSADIWNATCLVMSSPIFVCKTNADSRSYGR